MSLPPPLVYRILESEPRLVPENFSSVATANLGHLPGLRWRKSSRTIPRPQSELAWISSDHLISQDLVPWGTHLIPRDLIQAPSRRLTDDSE